MAGTLVNTNRTVKVHGYINDDENTNFITGMLIEASIISHVSKAISLPKSAVLKSENNYFALVLKDEHKDSYRFEKIKITIGLQEENYMEIENYQGLKNKKILIAVGLSML